MKTTTRLLFGLGLGVVLSACQSTKAPPEPEPRYVPDITLTNSVVLEVLPRRVPCNSSSPMQCLLVKSSGATDDKIFGIAYNHIQGFEPKVGIRYTIKARQEIDKNNGKPTGFWRLEEILTQNMSVSP